MASLFHDSRQRCIQTITKLRSGPNQETRPKSPQRKVNYRALRKTCIESGALWEDPDFKASASSLSSGDAQWMRELGVDPSMVKWKRPFEMTDDPKFFVEGASSSDVSEGSAGNAWFIAAVNALARQKSLFNKVVPFAVAHPLEVQADAEKKNDFTYCGLFRFFIYHFGEWRQVLVDDRLPVHPDSEVLLFSKSRTKKEFWPILLEKAYAKYLGSYELLRSYMLADALVDLTGGVSETYGFDGIELTPQIRDEFHSRLREAHKNGAPLCAIHQPTPSADEGVYEGRLPCGILKNRPYTVTGFTSIDISASSAIRTLFGGRQQLRMVRLQDPWADSKYTGLFGKNSVEWTRLSHSERAKLGLKLEQAAEFWVTYDDFLKYFNQFVICHLVRGISLFGLGGGMSQTSFAGEWTIGAKGTPQDRAGGSLPESRLRNPQFLIEITSDQAEIFVYIMQKAPFQPVGFVAMKVESNREFRLHRQKEIVFSSEFKSVRDHSSRLELQRNRYVIVLCTLEAETTHGNPYCVLQCEGISVRSQALKETSPNWEFEALFYRKNAQSEVKIQVWNHSVIMDSCIGRAMFEPGTSQQPQKLELPLSLKKTAGLQGTVALETFTTDDLLSV